MFRNPHKDTLIGEGVPAKNDSVVVDTETIDSLGEDDFVLESEKSVGGCEMRGHSVGSREPRARWSPMMNYSDPTEISCAFEVTVGIREVNPNSCCQGLKSFFSVLLAKVPECPVVLLDVVGDGECGKTKAFRAKSKSGFVPDLVVVVLRRWYGGEDSTARCAYSDTEEIQIGPMMPCTKECDDVNARWSKPRYESVGMTCTRVELPTVPEESYMTKRVS